MKKIIALILALVMLGSMSVFAADADVSSLTVGDDEGSFKVDADNANTASQSTDLWLQVEASGQIDVTLPLLLVFKTNIDGGEAATGTNYKITNNSSAPLVVTEVDTIIAANSGMTLVDYATAAYAEDTYGVQLTSGTTTIDLFDGKATNAKSALEGGVFELAKAAADGTGTATEVNVEMKTGEISFVTKYDDEGLAEEYGVKLLTVKYTVAIDTSEGKGTEIEGTVTGTVYTDGTAADQTYSYDYPNA